MAIEPQWIIGIAVLAVVLIVVLLFMRGSRKSRTESLREQFGGEYDHAVKESGSRRRAEADLVARTEEVKSFEIKPLSAADRDRFQKDWQRVETHFVERPAMAVAEADELVGDIMRVKGYPMGDFERHAAHLSVTHPRIVEHYRAGHKVMTGAPGSATTEDMRQSMLHYRALFTELINEPEAKDASRDVPRDVARDLPRENEVIASSPTARRDIDERLRDADDRPRNEGVQGDDLFKR